MPPTDPSKTVRPASADTWPPRSLPLAPDPNRRGGPPDGGRGRLSWRRVAVLLPSAELCCTAIDELRLDVAPLGSVADAGSAKKFLAP